MQQFPENISSVSIDTSSLTPNVMNSDDCKNALSRELQPILDNIFADNISKRRIVIKKDSLNFACPFCRDSASNAQKKRAHFILGGKFAGNFKCFNCGKSMKITNFFNAFEKDLPLATVTSVQHMVNSSTMFTAKTNTNLAAEIINKDDAKTYSISRDYLKSVLSLYEITPTGTPDAYQYLIGRCQTDMSRFLYSFYYQQIFILNLVDYNHILGLQMRDMTGTAAVKYKTMTCSKIHKLLLRDYNNIPEHIENLSTIFNIFNINLYSPIMVTEGPFDAFLLPNCIATSGANKNFGVNLPFWYLYDSDKTGTEHALKMLKKGYKVFMWKKLKQNLNLPYKNKWDITDVFKWIRDNNYTGKIQWSEYFTSSQLDGLNI